MPLTSCMTGRAMQQVTTCFRLSSCFMRSSVGQQWSGHSSVFCLGDCSRGYDQRPKRRAAPMVAQAGKEASGTPKNNTAGSLDEAAMSQLKARLFRSSQTKKVNGG